MKLVSFLDVVSTSQAKGRILEASAVSQEWLQRSGAHVKFWWISKVSSTYDLHSHMNDSCQNDASLPFSHGIEGRKRNKFPYFPAIGNRHSICSYQEEGIVLWLEPACFVSFLRSELSIFGEQCNFLHLSLHPQSILNPHKQNHFAQNKNKDSLSPT